MRRSVCKAALAYWAAIFALGIARVLWLAPHLGESAAVLIELPMMLAANSLAAMVRQIWSMRRIKCIVRSEFLL